jgi:hypothetical protein
MLRIECEKDQQIWEAVKGKYHRKPDSAQHRECTPPELFHAVVFERALVEATSECPQVIWNRWVVVIGLESRTKIPYNATWASPLDQFDERRLWWGVFMLVVAKKGLLRATKAESLGEVLEVFMHLPVYMESEEQHALWARVDEDSQKRSDPIYS